MKKSKVTRSLLAACSIVALSAVMYGCVHNGGSDAPATDDTGMDMPDPAIAERAAIDTAINAAETAVAGIGDDSTDSEVSAANMAVTGARTAISNAENLPKTETDANTRTVNAIANRLSAALDSRKMAMDDAADQMKKDMAATGKALRAALGGPAAGGNALANIDTATTPVSLTAAGLVIDAAQGAGVLHDTEAAGNPGSVTLMAGDSAGALGSWMGMDYMHTDTGTKVVNAARVYNNKGPGKTVSLADAGINVHTAATAGDDIKGYYTVNEAADVAKIMGAAFTHSGTQSHSYDSDSEVAFTTRGTFDGAPGTYRCAATSPTVCSSTNDGTGSPSALTGVWHFKPDAGAMVHQPDAHYLYYGWWVSKDKDGMPTAASAFTGRVGTDATDGTDSLDPGWSGAYTAGTTLSGSATYAGHAAGKFAMSNVLDGTGNGGHFTADASLSAKFSDPNNGITGTIDNFRLNDGSEDPGWSVSLHRADFGADGAITASTATPNDNTANGTTWSIGGNSAPESGTWSGTMYDEMPGDPPNGDGSTIPTTVTGTFYSEFSTIGRMVGAFGADKQ